MMSEGKVEVCDNIIAVTSYGNADWLASANCSLHSFRQMYFLLSWHFVVHETHGKQESQISISSSAIKILSFAVGFLYLLTLYLHYV